MERLLSFSRTELALARFAALAVGVRPDEARAGDKRDRDEADGDPGDEEEEGGETRLLAEAQAAGACCCCIFTSCLITSVISFLKAFSSARTAARRALPSLLRCACSLSGIMSRTTVSSRERGRRSECSMEVEAIENIGLC